MGKELINYEELLSGMAVQQATLERPSGSTISTRAGVLSYNGQPCPGNKLDCIIIASVHSNTLYEGRFDPNNLSSPVCFAYSESGQGMAPHPASAKPQSESCDTCPNNQWGSDPDGGRGKACKNGRVLALIPANTQPEAVPTAEIAILRPPVTSVKNYQQHVQTVAALYNRPPLGVITEVGTVPDVKSQYKVTFTEKGPLDISMIKPILDRIPAALETCQKIYEANKEAPAGSDKAKKF
jgi:hypothetical protein